MKKFLTDEDGSELVEYVLLVSLVAMICIPALQSFTNAITAFWDTISGRLAS